MLMLVRKVENSFPRATHVVYYRNYASQHQPAYKNLSCASLVLLTHCQLHFKVVRLQPDQPPL